MAGRKRGKSVYHLSLLPRFRLGQIGAYTHCTASSTAPIRLNRMSAGGNGGVRLCGRAAAGRGLAAARMPGVEGTEGTERVRHGLLFSLAAGKGEQSRRDVPRGRSHTRDLNGADRLQRHVRGVVDG